jgi:hypothetical protein
LFSPLPAWSTTSSFWPTRIEAAFVVSVTVTSKPIGLELVLGDGLVVRPEPGPTLPQPEISKAAEITTNRILMSKT